MFVGEFLSASHGFPVSTLARLLGEGGLVVIAPHPDDESLACGGLIAEACARGRAVRVVVVTDGAGSHPRSQLYPAARLRDLREDEARQAVRELGLDPVRDIVFLRMPDRFLSSEGPSAEEAAAAILDCVASVRAQALFVSWRHDPHCDHQACYRIALSVQRRQPTLRLYEYSVWGSALPPTTRIEPATRGFRLPVGEHRERKRRAVASHRSQTTDLIDDDPDGFQLSAADLARHDAPYEIFFEGPSE